MLKANTSKNILAIFVTAFVSFIGILTETSLNVTFPTVMRQFKINLATVQWTTTGYLLAIAIIMITSSYLNLRFTAKQLFSLSCAGFILGCLLCALSPNFWVLLGGRLLSSLGAGIATPLMFNLIIELMPKRKWGLFMGIAGLIIAMAPTLGPAFGGLINYYLNWRAIFIISLIFASLLFIVGLAVVRQYHPVKKNSFAWLSFFWLALSLLCLSLALNRLSFGLVQVELWLLLTLSFVFGFLFVVNSKKSEKRLFDLRLFKNRAFLAGTAAYFLLQFINIGISFVLPNFTQIVGHINSMVAGLLLLPGSLLAGLLNPLFGKLYDEWGGRRLLYCGSILVFLSCLLLTSTTVQFSLVLIAALYAFLSLGHRMSFSNTLAETLKQENKKMQSDATAVCQTAQQLAGSFGTTIMAAIIAYWQKQGANYQSLTAKGCNYTFIFAAILAIIILFCDYLLLKRGKDSNNMKIK